jgi:hypothetical protein
MVPDPCHPAALWQVNQWSKGPNFAESVVHEGSDY